MKYLFIPANEVNETDLLENTYTLKRLERGLKEWRKGGYDKIIVAGGIWMPEKIQTRPLGILMKDWLISQGVAAEKIITENTSRDTYENISGALELIKDDLNPEITVVTHWQHALRFRVTFRRAHKMKIKIITMWYWVNLKTFIFEWPFLLIHIFDKDGTSSLVRKNRSDRNQVT